jgi:hypothetical protein
MSHILYDFLADSLLFRDDYIDSAFSSTSDEDIDKVLQAYRNHCLQNNDKIESEISKSDLSIFMGSPHLIEKNLPSDKLLKQCSLYFDHFIIDDPIFKLARSESDIAKGVASYLGFNNEGTDRKELVGACKYMKQVAPLVAGNFVKFAPNSLLHEAPSEIPLVVPKDYYRDALPKDLMKWFHENAKISELRKDGDKWIVVRKDSLAPCRGIFIEFKGASPYGNIYHLFEPEQVKENGDRFGVRMSLPTTPPDAQLFQAWVFQSLNKSASSFVETILKDVSQAARMRSYYMTESKFVSELLQKNAAVEKDFKVDIANHFLRLELPVVEDVSFDRIMTLRQDKGKAFEAFRIGLEKKLKELRTIKDEDEIRIKLQNISHELTDVEVFEVKKELSKIKSKFLGDATIFTVGLSSFIQSHGFGLLAMGYAFANGCKTYAEYRNSMKINPGYFFWKLKNKKFNFRK